MASNNFKMNQNQMLGYQFNANQNQMMRPNMNIGQQNNNIQGNDNISNNQPGGFIQNQINQINANSNNINNIERQPEKRSKLNDGNIGNSNNNNLGLQGGNQMGLMPDQNFKDRNNDNIINQINQKDNEKKNQQNLLKEFDTMQFRYSNEQYNHQINKFCKRIASEKHAQEIACKFPLYKMIRSIIKKFLFNELELIFFGYVLEESKWKVDDVEVRKQAYYMIDFLNITEVKDILDYKSVLLYLILMAYAVKFYLNDEQEMRVFNQHMHTIVKDFSSLFQYWSKAYGATALKIIPKSLNRVYRNLSKRPNEQNKKIHEDYNGLVDAIIQISPPYNNEKGGGGGGESNPSGPPQQDSGKPAKGGGKNNGSGLNIPESSSLGASIQKPGNQFQQTQNELLSKIVEQKQRKQQEQQQQQSQQSSLQQFGKNTGNRPQSTGLDSIGTFQPTGQNNNFLNQQQQKFTGNQANQQQNTGGRDIGDFQSEFNNPTSTGILQSDSSQIQKKDINFLQQFNNSGNIDGNMDFFQNINMASNNNYNFNGSYPSININNYPSFLQNFNGSQAQIDGTKQGVSFTQGKQGATGMQMQNMTQGQSGSNIQNNQNFGLQVSSNFEGNNANLPSSSHPVGTNLGQSGVFNTYSNGFIGQGNNSFNSHQVGFNQLNQFQNQNNSTYQNSLQGLLLQTQQQQQKKN